MSIDKLFLSLYVKKKFFIVSLSGGFYIRDATPELHFNNFQALKNSA